VISLERKFMLPIVRVRLFLLLTGYPLGSPFTNRTRDPNNLSSCFPHFFGPFVYIVKSCGATRDREDAKEQDKTAYSLKHDDPPEDTMSR
jgi:hypothetical protein